MNTGPLVSVNSLVRKSNRLVPVMSPGIRSGVNWMRLKSSDRQRAKTRARSVLAVPGSPSSSACPSARSATRSSDTASS